MMENSSVDLLDLESKSNSFLKEVLVGLSKGQKATPAKLLYDKKGSEIFERICELKEYYPNRAEKEILKRYGREIAQLIGPEALIIEPGCGTGEKVRYILSHLERPQGYVPIEISREVLLQTTSELHEEFPSLKIMPVCGDFTQELELPLSIEAQAGKKVMFFPGSTIGNLTPAEAVQFLKRYRKMAGTGGRIILGVDLKKDSETLELAYDDPQGVTAEFNMNLLKRLNREAQATFDLENFEHQAFYNERMGRVEMHLVSKVPQLVRVHQTVFRFKEGESIHTESSYKYTVDEFCELCAKAGLRVKKFWQDSQKLFCVYYFEKDEL